MDTDLVSAAHAVDKYAQLIRTALHVHPETRYDTANTRRLIKNQLVSMGFEQFSESKGGLVLDLDFPGAQDRILLRADFDALPVPEATGLPFASTIPGKSHACGHDVHTAMLLGFLKLVADGAVVPKHNLRIVFQDAEENPGSDPDPISGGEHLVREGVCDGVVSAHGLHIWARGEPGVFTSRPGPLLGNSGRIVMHVKAAGGHAALPHHGSNALRVAKAIMNTLDSFIARTLPPAEAAVLDPMICHGGTATNVMPASAELAYSCRTMLPGPAQKQWMAKLEAEIRYVVSGFPDASVEVEKIFGHPSLVNNEADYARVRDVLASNGQPVGIEPQFLGGEDFAHYLYQVPGSFWLLGAGQGERHDHHCPGFNPDPSVFWRGVLFWSLLATN